MFSMSNRLKFGSRSNLAYILHFELFATRTFPIGRFSPAQTIFPIQSLKAVI